MRASFDHEAEAKFDAVLQASGTNQTQPSHDQSTVDKLTSFGWSVYQELKRCLKLAVLKLQVLKIQFVDVKTARLALGKRVYELQLGGETHQVTFDEIQSVRDLIQRKLQAKDDVPDGGFWLQKVRWFGGIVNRTEAWMLEYGLRHRFEYLGKKVEGVEDGAGIREELDTAREAVQRINEMESRFELLSADKAHLTNTITHAHAFGNWARGMLRRFAAACRRLFQIVRQRKLATAMGIVAAALLVLFSFFMITLVRDWIEIRSTDVVAASVSFGESDKYRVTGKQLWKIRRKAWLGDAAAAYQLSVCYLEGQGVGKDPAAGWNWLSLAAERGNPVAQTSLGSMYFQGVTPEGVKDPAEGLKWMRKAAETGNARSQSTLGIMYYKGMGVDVDKQEGTKWLKMAAMQEDSAALDFLEEEGIHDPALPKRKRYEAPFDPNNLSPEDQRILEHLLR